MIEQQPAQPEILHQSTGLTIKRNAKNKFVVVSLLYTADERKRTPEWEAEAKAGMPEAQWRKEYCLDYLALAGQKVFPEIHSRRREIVIPPTGFDEHQPFWGGFDFGQRNASSFHAYTIYDGVTYACWELYEPCKNLIEFADKLKACPYWSRIKYIVADTNMWEHRAYSKDHGVPVSVVEQLADLGIKNLVKADKSQEGEAAWLAMMRRHWGQEEITFKIFETCPKMIWEFENAIFEGDQLDIQANLKDKNFKERIKDKDNHALDECRYFMLSRPKERKTQDLMHAAKRAKNLFKGWRKW